MTIIIHDAPQVTNLNPFRVQEEFAAQQAARAAEQAKKKHTAEQAKKDIVAEQSKLQPQTDKLNQREVELMNREKALTSQMASWAKEKIAQEKRFAELERKHEETRQSLEHKLAKLRELVT